MRLNLSLKVFLLALSCSTVAHAQDSFFGLLRDGLGAEERLLYKKPVGPYTVTVNGERLIERTYFKLDIRRDGEPVADEITVEVKITPPDSAGSKIQRYTAVYKASYFIVDPILLRATQNWGDDLWLVDIRISAPAESVDTTFTMQVYPPKPSAPFIFRAVSILLPIAVVLGFAGAFTLQGVKLEHSTKPTFTSSRTLGGE